MSQSLLTSLSLLDRLQDSQNTEAWEVFVSVYRPVLQRHLVTSGICASDADDLTQEVLTKVFVAIGSFRHNGRTGAFRKWLRTIVVRESMEFLRKRKKFQSVTQELCQTQRVFDDFFQDRWDRAHDEYVMHGLLELIRPEFTDTTWTAFSLQVLAGKSAHDVAAHLESSVNAVLVSKSRVLRRLRQLGRGMIEW